MVFGLSLYLIYASEIESRILQNCCKLNQILYNQIFFLKGQIPNQLKIFRYNSNITIRMKNLQPHQIPTVQQK